MGIKAVDRYVIGCDRCLRSPTYDEYKTDTEAENAAEEAGFIETSDHRWLCKRCQTTPTMELEDRLRSVYGLSPMELEALVAGDDVEIARMVRERPRVALALDELRESLAEASS